MEANGGSTRFECSFHNICAMTSTGHTVVNEELHDHLKRITLTVGTVLTNGATPFTKFLDTLTHVITIAAIVASHTFRASILTVVSCCLVKSLVP